MSDETETVAGYISNYLGSVTVVIPGLPVEPGSTAVNATQEALSTGGSFSIVFNQGDSNINLCSGTGNVDAQTSAGLTDTAPNPTWGQAST